MVVEIGPQYIEFYMDEVLLRSEEHRRLALQSIEDQWPGYGRRWQFRYTGRRPHEVAIRWYR